MVKTFLALISLSIPSMILAQNNDGYWDKDRATTREQILSAGSKTWLRKQMNFLSAQPKLYTELA